MCFVCLNIRLNGTYTNAHTPLYLYFTRAKFYLWNSVIFKIIQLYTKNLPSSWFPVSLLKLLLLQSDFLCLHTIGPLQ